MSPGHAGCGFYGTGRRGRPATRVPRQTARRRISPVRAARLCRGVGFATHALPMNIRALGALVAALCSAPAWPPCSPPRRTCASSRGSIRPALVRSPRCSSGPHPSGARAIAASTCGSRGRGGALPRRWRRDVRGRGRRPRDRRGAAPVRPALDARAGQRVGRRRRDRLRDGADGGHPGTGGSHCAPRACLHWGVRRGDEYLDPLDVLRGYGPIRAACPLRGGDLLEGAGLDEAFAQLLHRTGVDLGHARLGHAEDLRRSARA